MKTRTLPTDKHGNVYYGPKTLAAAIDATSQEYDLPGRGISIQEAARKVAYRLDRAGYTGVAARLIKHYDAKIS